MKRPMVVGSVAYFGAHDPGAGISNLYSFNGTTRSTVASSVWDHTVGTDGNLYYLTSAGDIKNVSGTTVETAPTGARSIAYINGEFWCGTKDGHLWRRYP